ncbi:methyltransferase domain-containing protein [Candidatus Pacearchaeota archaeon]|nr:methyltransferase domain-containing protein [Candidatus Pacearchaeota archaeon]
MKLNFGCGKDIKKGYVNLDHVSINGVNVVHDINKFPYPFKDNEFEEILCIGSLEYVDDLFKVMQELYRISKPGAIIKINGPYWHSSACYPHLTTFNIDSFKYFDENDSYSYYTKARFKLIKVKLIPSKAGKLIPRLPIPRKLFPNVLDFRHLVSYFLGEIILRVYFELKVVK